MGTIAGGQGMNLGLRDAIGLGPVLAAHLKAFQTMPAQPDLDKPLCEYAAARHTRALEVIHLTKSLIKSASYLDSTGLTSRVMITLVRFLMKFRFFQSAVAWRLSGLGAR
jgi:2-polyprenyl-6-methoxyphenol hydroxylase-like FAD-dependent oxidoreductase